jgi:outer membrane protein, multidrug efflux system
MLKPLLIISLAAGLASCNVGPDYHTPNIPIESSYGPTTAQPDANAAWWTALNDSTLDSLIAAAAENNLDLQQAQARIREARAQHAVVSGGQWPTLNADGQYQHQRYSQNAAPFNAFNIPGFPWEFNLYQVGFDASWEIDVFGGTRRAVETAAAQVQAAQEDKNAVLVSLLAEVARNYVELRGYQQERILAQRNVDAQNQSLELTRDRMNKGVGTQLDVARASALVDSTAASIPNYERDEWQAIHRLAVLTNQPLDKLLYLHEASPIPATPDSVMAGIPADLLRRRPDIRRAERNLAVATARVGVAEAQLYPKFYITGMFSMQSASIDDVFDWRSRAFSIGPAISWPIFEAGRLRAAVVVKNAQQEQALLTYEQSVQSAIQEVRDELVAFAAEHRRRDSLARAVDADEESVELANQLYTQGLTDFLSVLDAQRQLYQAQDDLAQSDAKLDSALIALYKALGGGWENGPPISSLAPMTSPATTSAQMSTSQERKP